MENKRKRRNLRSQPQSATFEARWPGFFGWQRVFCVAQARNFKLGRASGILFMEVSYISPAFFFVNAHGRAVSKFAAPIRFLQPTPSELESIRGPRLDKTLRARFVARAHVLHSRSGPSTSQCVCVYCSPSTWEASNCACDAHLHVARVSFQRQVTLPWAGCVLCSLHWSDLNLSVIIYKYPKLHESLMCSNRSVLCSGA